MSVLAISSMRLRRHRDCDAATLADAAPSLHFFGLPRRHADSGDPYAAWVACAELGVIPAPSPFPVAVRLTILGRLVTPIGATAVPLCSVFRERGAGGTGGAVAAVTVGWWGRRCRLAAGVLVGPDFAAAT